jgi:hypothetical protein
MEGPENVCIWWPGRRKVPGGQNLVPPRIPRHIQELCSISYSSGLFADSSSYPMPLPLRWWFKSIYDDLFWSARCLHRFISFPNHEIDNLFYAAALGTCGAQVIPLRLFLWAPLPFEVFLPRVVAGRYKVHYWSWEPSFPHRSTTGVNSLPNLSCHDTDHLGDRWGHFLRG